MSTPQSAQPATASAMPMVVSSAGHNGSGTSQESGDTHTLIAGAGNGSLNGQRTADAQRRNAIEGQDTPSAMKHAYANDSPPTGEEAAQPAKHVPASIVDALAGHEAGRDQSELGPQGAHVPALSIPSAQSGLGAQCGSGTGEQTPPAASARSAPTEAAPLADPLLALAADVLGDLEKVRIANENRLRQLTRSAEDADGEIRGFGLDDAHPDVARLAALVGMLAEAEHKATLNLNRLMRKHPLGEWVKRQKGVGEKQAARLLAAIGDPYIRPEIIREDGTVEASRPRMVSELWAFAGYHVIRADHRLGDPPRRFVGAEQDGHPGQYRRDSQTSTAGVAPKRARGQKANWSGAAKMRAYLVAESCIKQMDGEYRKVYDATRAKYAEAVHATECIRCGPKGKPAQPGSPLSDGHKHARGLRRVAKEILRDLWREAKAIHEASASSHSPTGTQINGAPGGAGPQPEGGAA